MREGLRVHVAASSVSHLPWRQPLQGGSRLPCDSPHSANGHEESDQRRFSAVNWRIRHSSTDQPGEV